MADPTTDERAPLDDEVFALVHAARPPAVPFDAVRRETVRSLLDGATLAVGVADDGASSDRLLDGSGASEVDVEAGAMAAAGGDRAGTRGRRRVRVAAWLVAAAVIAGAVGLATRSGDQRRVATSDGEVGWQVPVLADLVGTTYRWTSATENGAALVLLPEFTVGFGTPEGAGTTPYVSAATCNGGSGKATIRAGRLVAPEYAQTLMACGDARGAAERFWNALLAEEPEIAVRGDELRLRSASRELVATSAGRALASLRPAKATELERTRWMIFAASMSDTTPNWGELWFGRDSVAIGGVCGSRRAPLSLSADGLVALGAASASWSWPAGAAVKCTVIDLEPLDRFLRNGSRLVVRGDVLRAEGPDGWLEAVRVRPDVDLDTGGVPPLAVDTVGPADIASVRIQIDTITDARGTVQVSDAAREPVVLSADAQSELGVSRVRFDGLCPTPTGAIRSLGIGIDVRLDAASSTGGSCSGAPGGSSRTEALLRAAFAHPLAWLGSRDGQVLARSDIEISVRLVPPGAQSPTAAQLVPPTAAAAPLPTPPPTAAAPTTALDGRAATMDDVEGRTFSVTTFVVGGSARDVSFGQPSLVFTSTPDGLKLDAGACLHGIVTIDAGRLHGTVDRTPRACGADLHQLDEPLKSLLNGEPAITIDARGRLTVTGADAQIVTDFRETRRDEHVPTLEELSGRSFAVDEVVHGFVGQPAAAVIEFDGDTGTARWLTVTANGSCSSRRFIDLTIASGRLAGNRDGTRDPSCAATASEDLLLALVAGNPRITLEPAGGPSVATLLLDNGGDSVRAVEVVAPMLADTTWRYAGLRAEPTGDAPGAMASHGIDAALRFTGAWSGGSDGWTIEGPCASLSGTVDVAGPPHRTYLTVTSDRLWASTCYVLPEAQDEWRRLREIVLAVSDLRADAGFLRLTSADGRMALFTRA